jgi:hypothetical protein
VDIFLALMCSIRAQNFSALFTYVLLLSYIRRRCILCTSRN